MQRPAELVPIPECGVKASESFGKLRESSGKLLHFGKIPKTFAQNLATIQQHSGKFRNFAKFLQKMFSKSAKIQQLFYCFNEKIEIR